MRKITNEPQENSLNTLIEKAKNDHQSVTKEVRRNLNLVDEARQERISWSKIADALGFPGKFREVEKAYRKEKQNQKTEKKLVVEKKPTPEVATPPRLIGRKEEQKPSPMKTEKKDPEVKYKSSFNIDDDEEE